MEAAERLFSSLAAWWAEVPPIPDLPLPHPGDVDVLIVVATVVLLLGAAGLVSAWADGRRSAISLGAVLVGAALFFWAWEVERTGFDLARVPNAFVEMVARAIR
ncbi:hypothetical protein [Jannaschia ovalis]|uniref:Uncharacterized protein n=1 Tax=Jannaschia ovalis TaxID=3038773 RepID=A0ABY8LEU5_9RHOB|nr:hypothetical protein [Jannaschia sp. GRR-S6-38]WGH79827.1 hypothetical protein P8627_06075 [Jannaschia sp. GRR-S6-38]